MTDPTAPARKLFLPDAFSKNPRVNSRGLNTGAVLGFTNTLVEVLQQEKPTLDIAGQVLAVPSSQELAQALL